MKKKKNEFPVSMALFIVHVHLVFRDQIKMFAGVI